jgi:hypothetical protein
VKDKAVTSSSSGGIGFVGLLTVALIVLKLTGYIDWSWWWVWSPMWINCILLLLIFVVAFVIVLIVELLK